VIIYNGIKCSSYVWPNLWRQVFFVSCVAGIWASLFADSRRWYNTVQYRNTRSLNKQSITGRYWSHEANDVLFQSRPSCISCQSELWIPFLNRLLRGNSCKIAVPFPSLIFHLFLITILTYTLHVFHIKRWSLVDHDAIQLTAQRIFNTVWQHFDTFHAHVWW